MMTQWVEPMRKMFLGRVRNQWESLVEKPVPASSTEELIEDFPFSKLFTGRKREGLLILCLNASKTKRNEAFSMNSIKDLLDIWKQKGNLT
jgi:hypothetical protein